MYKVTISDGDNNFLVFQFSDYIKAMDFIDFAISNAVAKCEVFMTKEEVGLNG